MPEEYGNCDEEWDQDEWVDDGRNSEEYVSMGREGESVMSSNRSSTHPPEASHNRVGAWGPRHANGIGLVHRVDRTIV